MYQYHIWFVKITILPVLLFSMDWYQYDMFYYWLNRHICFVSYYELRHFSLRDRNIRPLYETQCSEELQQLYILTVISVVATSNYLGIVMLNTYIDYIIVHVWLPIRGRPPERLRLDRRTMLDESYSSQYRLRIRIVGAHKSSSSSHYSLGVIALPGFINFSIVSWVVLFLFSQLNCNLIVPWYLLSLLRNKSSVHCCLRSIILFVIGSISNHTLISLFFTCLILYNL